MADRLEPRPYQESAIAAHWRYFEDHEEGDPLFVMPTGSGKSLVIAEMIRRSLIAWPDTRYLVLTHVRELVQQDLDAFVRQWGPDAPAGVVSAGMGRRDYDAPVVFAGIQSAYSKVEQIGNRDLVLVDEAHLVPKRGQGRYLTMLARMRERDASLRMCGYTATHYRLDGGYLHRGEGRMFTDVAHEVSLLDLIDDGYLVPLVAESTDAKIDVGGVRSQRGEFLRSELQAAAMRGDLVHRAVREIVARAGGRKSWLVFCCGVEHAAAVLEELRALDVDAAMVLGSTPKDERDAKCEAFRSGRLTALVSVGVLTTGFDAPRCDLMAILRPTKSTSLYVQMMGRGMRTSSGKKDCLVLDFGRNVERHGPVNAVRIHQPQPGGEEVATTPAAKTCPECKLIVYLAAQRCPRCGHVFSEHSEHDARPGKLAPIDRDAGTPKVLDVDTWFLRIHKKKGKPESLRVDLACGMQSVSFWACFAHGGYAATKAVRWWCESGGSLPAPRSAQEALERRDEITMPEAVDVVPDGSGRFNIRRWIRPARDSSLRYA